MKKVILLITLFIVAHTTIAQVNPNLVNIPSTVFVNGGKTDFDSLLKQGEDIKEKVKILHTYDEISHDLTTQISNFETYWSRYSTQWYSLKFKENENPLLLFKGIRNTEDEREYVEIYNVENKRNNRTLFNKVGKLLAYKIHPRTQEVILYTHKYPCCQSASHNIYRIRQTEEGLKINDRFFVGRDSGDMVGPFFPETVQFSEKYHRLSEKTELRWSPAIVEENAFENWTESNLMIHYNKNALYKILYEKDNWQFVVFFQGITEEQSRMLNYTNFRNKGVYGWIKV